MIHNAKERLVLLGDKFHNYGHKGKNKRNVKQYL